MKKRLILLTALTLSLYSSAYAAEVGTKSNYEIEKGKTDVGIQMESDRKPLYFLETVQPLGKQTERGTNFTQIRIGTGGNATVDGYDAICGGTTLNLGVGRRILSKNKGSMFGVNAFYDHGFKHGHSRISGGLEYFEGRNEYRVNVYRALSGDKQLSSSSSTTIERGYDNYDSWTDTTVTTSAVFEKALGGFDYSFGTSFKSAPWAKVYVTGYHWNYKNSKDVNGFKIAVPLQITPKVSLEVGYLHDNKVSSRRYAQIMYNFGKRGPAMLEDGKHIFRNEEVTVASKRLDKVRRENDMKVEVMPKSTSVTTRETFNRVTT